MSTPNVVLIDISKYCHKIDLINWTKERNTTEKKMRNWERKIPISPQSTSFNSIWHSKIMLLYRPKISSEKSITIKVTRMEKFRIFLPLKWGMSWPNHGARSVYFWHVSNNTFDHMLPHKCLELSESLWMIYVL